MDADEIRELNVRCQDKMKETESIPAHNAALWSLGLSLLAELTAQVAQLNAGLEVVRGEVNGYLAKVANPPMVEPGATSATSSQWRR